MPPETTPPRDSYIIAVTGAMNPLVHTPQFYRSIGAMDEAELQASLMIPTNTTTATTSEFQFSSPRITINCQPTQWWIQTSDHKLCERMISILSLVFAKLGATPVNGYAIAAQLHIDTAVSDVKSALAKRIAKLKLGLPVGKSTASSVEMAVAEEDYSIVAAVQPSVLSERAVYVFYQRQYSLPAPKVGVALVMGDLVKSRIEKFDVAYKECTTAAVAAIDAMEGKG